MSEPISKERLKELANSGHTKFYNRLSIPLPEVESMARELLALRTAAEGMEKALDGLMDLFCDPSPLYIKKLGGPITNGDQDRIDEAFVVGQDALAAYRKAVAK